MNTRRAKDIEIAVTPDSEVSALLTLAPDALALYVLAHGAGAGMRHSFMESISSALLERRIATLRYQFPYMERGSKRPDPPPLCHATVRAAVAKAAQLAPGLPLFAGGKSFGGRMTSQAQAAAALPGVRGLVFVGFPLHPAKKPATARGDHLAGVQIPMLFLQGTRDELAEMALIEGVTQKLGALATLARIDGADHSFHVLARSGRKDGQVMEELADRMAEWVRPLV
jgi:predicted alpha/beta-hydrolase family hydrolase